MKCLLRGFGADIFLTHVILTYYCYASDVSSGFSLKIQGFPDLQDKFVSFHASDIRMDTFGKKEDFLLSDSSSFSPLLGW